MGKGSDVVAGIFVSPSVFLGQRASVGSGKPGNAIPETRPRGGGLEDANRETRPLILTGSMVDLKEADWISTKSAVRPKGRTNERLGAASVPMRPPPHHRLLLVSSSSSARFEGYKYDGRRRKIRFRFGTHPRRYFVIRRRPARRSYAILRVEYLPFLLAIYCRAQLVLLIVKYHFEIAFGFWFPSFPLTLRGIQPFYLGLSRG